MSNVGIYLCNINILIAIPTPTFLKERYSCGLTSNEQNQQENFTLDIKDIAEEGLNKSKYITILYSKCLE